MAKKSNKPVFKHYDQQQGLLLPPSLDDLISATHLVRVVNQIVDEMDISSLLEFYPGGGSSSYHPSMLLKILLYGYSVKIYTGRKIASALNHDINFMWLSAMSHPDFRTINNFRSSKAKEVIEDLFKELLVFLVEHKYIKLENYFCDGSPMIADANKNKMVWKKNAERYKEATEKRCKKLFEDIDRLNLEENNQYGDNDLEENGDQSTIDQGAINKHVEQLNEKIKIATTKQKKRQIESLKNKLTKEQSKLQKYQNQIEIAQERSGYNKTDHDATAMIMKNKIEVLPAYNIIAGCEDQFITGISVHQNTNDGTCFSKHFEQAQAQQPVQVKNIIADSIFGTEQNYEILEDNKIGNYMKFPQFHSEQKKKNRENPFLKTNFIYINESDHFICPNNKKVVFKCITKQINKKTGYESTIREYQCEDCDQCPYYQQCCKSQKGGNRTISINEKLERFKQQARENLTSKEGVILRKARGIEIESCFGDIKHNMGFRRFHLRGTKKVDTEIKLIAMAHNLRKLYLKLNNAV